VVSKDEDFLHLAKLDATGPALVWVRMSNCPKATLLSAFKSVLPSLIDSLEAGQRVIEIR